MAHMISAWEELLKDAVKMQRQLMKNATVVFAFIEVRCIYCQFDHLTILSRVHVY